MGLGDLLLVDGCDKGNPVACISLSYRAKQQEDSVGELHFLLQAHRCGYQSELSDVDRLIQASVIDEIGYRASRRLAKPKENFTPPILEELWAVAPASFAYWKATESFKRWQERCDLPDPLRIGVQLEFQKTGEAMVKSVVAGSPAMLSGILPGDVLLEVDGTPVKLGRLRNLESADAEVLLRVLRDGQHEKEFVMKPIPLGEIVKRADKAVPWPGWNYLDQIPFYPLVRAKEVRERGGGSRDAERGF